MAYTDWIKRFILYFGKQHPRDLGAREIEQFLTHFYCLPSSSLVIQCLGIAHEIRESTLSSLA
ncbi:phage integrase N-terminal SAM-like domain-containing protein [Methylomonas sp. MK1]|uniref:phage integrase N-terminal SAM-like domain-containing protein n=1 Tax=Methylomonas sp. MK1 TaxID=1131552 RepID=UPI0003A8ED1C|nr:phage integrase N-terminal SAM-like domain-containing protein [Methylomonas sp. MK1]